MSETLRPRVKYVIGPDGSPLTIADLPPPSTRRWVIRRKAEVVAAVRGGLLSLEDACSRYTLTVDELLSWQVSIDSMVGWTSDDPHPAISALPVGPRSERSRGAPQTSAPSGHKLAAIDLDNLPNDIGAERLRGEEQVGADAFFGCSEPGDRDRLANCSPMASASV